MSFRLDAIDPAYVETSQWVLETAEFQQWRDRPLHSDPNIFWLKGKSGTGKSTIMKTVVKHLGEREQGSIVLSFFFNARGQPLEQSVEGLYRTLLHQLFKRVPSLFITSKAMQMYAHKPAWSAEMLRGLFCDAVLSLQQEKVLIVVDALDEGEEKEVRSMVDFARNLARSAFLKNVSLNICFASRHYPSINVPGCREVVVEEQLKHAQDIARYIRGTLNLDYGQETYSFAQAITQKARGVFLWVTLVVKLLNERYDHGATQNELIATLETTPPGLNDLLRRITSSGQSGKRLLPALLWVLCNVSGPFNVCELYVAIQVGTGVRDKSLDHGNLPSMHRYITSASKGLVESVPFGDSRRRCRYAGNASCVTETSDVCGCYVQFIHESIPEYLLSGGMAELCPELSPDVEGRGHALLARWYQDYMRSFSPILTPFPAYRTRGIVIDTDSVTRQHIEKFTNTSSYHFCRRALASTFRHVQNAYHRGQLAPDILQGFPVIQWANMENVDRIERWEKLHPALDTPLNRWHTHGNRLEAPASLLYVLISKNCADLAMKICRDFPAVLTSITSDHTNLPVVNAIAGPEIDPLASESLNIVCGGHYGSPLGAAVGTKSIDMIKFLLSRGADINFHGGAMGSPLQMAVRDGNIEIVQLLTDDSRSADAPSLSRVSGSCLSTAVETFNLDMVRLLLDRGADMNKLPGLSNHLLWTAAHLEIPSIVRLLLERGAVIDPQALPSPWVAAFSETAARASRGEKKAILRLLADHLGTVINVQGLSRALLIAMSPYSECRKLVTHDDDHVDSRTYCVLHGVWPNVCAAMAVPHDETIATMCMLLEFGADPNAIGGDFETPLIAASVMGKEPYVKILLAFGADTRYRSEIYGTAVEAAEAKGWENVVAVLLQAEQTDDTAATGEGLETWSSEKCEDDVEDDGRWRDNEFEREFVNEYAIELNDECLYDLGGWARSYAT
jgi:ankyrin repeat protein